MRLATKILLAFGLLLLTALAAVAFFAGRSAAGEVRGALSRGGMTPASIMARELTAYYRGNRSWDGVGSVLAGPASGMMGMMGAQRMVLLDEDGTVVADSTDELTGTTFQPKTGMEVIVIRVAGQAAGRLVVVETPAPAPEEAFLSGIYRSLFMAALLTGAVGLVIALVLSRSLTAPIRRLSEAMLRFARGDRGIELPAPSQDEVGELARTFSHLAAEIERQENLRRDMTADIAHELRTPLSVLRANLEALADGVYPLTADSLQPLSESVQLLSRLVEDLRTLALAESGRLPLERTPVDPADLLRRTAARHTLHAAQQFQRVEVAIADDLPVVNADPQRLEQVLGNLIDNASRVSPDSARVLLTARAESGGVRLTVEDEGPGIPAQELERIFDRFYRLDDGRTRMEGGSGLGLAIARKIIEAHGGTICAENRPEGGARFVITLPA